MKKILTIKVSHGADGEVSSTAKVWNGTLPAELLEKIDEARSEYAFWWHDESRKGQTLTLNFYSKGYSTAKVSPSGAQGLDNLLFRLTEAVEQLFVRL